MESKSQPLGSCSSLGANCYLLIRRITKAAMTAASTPTSKSYRNCCMGEPPFGKLAHAELIPLWHRKGKEQNPRPPSFSLPVFPPFRHAHSGYWLHFPLPHGNPSILLPFPLRLPLCPTRRCLEALPPSRQAGREHRAPMPICGHSLASARSLPKLIPRRHACRRTRPEPVRSALALPASQCA